MATLCCYFRAQGRVCDAVAGESPVRPLKKLPAAKVARVKHSWTEMCVFSGCTWRQLSCMFHFPESMTGRMSLFRFPNPF